MRSILVMTTGVALLCGTAALSTNGAAQPQQIASSDTAIQVPDAAFRDGIFQGRLAAEQGRSPHLSAGRWSRDSDRQSFVAGYQLGYAEASGTAITVPEGVEQIAYREGLQEGAEDRGTGRSFRLSPDTARVGETALARQTYENAYANGYQLGYYGKQQLATALVIKPVLGSRR